MAHVKRAKRAPANTDLPDPFKAGKPYVQKIEVHAVRMDRPFKVRSRDGVQEGKAGDYLCANKDGGKWVVVAGLFHALFRPDWDCHCFSGCKCGKYAWPPPEAPKK